MNKNILIVMGVLILVIGGVAFYFQHIFQNNASSVTEINQIAQPVSNQNTGAISISIQNFKFNPDSLTINKGDTVIWTNQDAMPHKISGSGFVSNNLSNGQSYSFTFKDAGNYEYICSIHPSMKGKIIVK